MVKVKEVDFPRGPVPKSGSNSARETKKTKQPSFLQDIFQERPEIDETTNGTKKSKKKNKLTSDEVQLLAGSRGDSFPGELLTYDNICEDVLSLGRVSKIQDGKLTVNLPCRVVGELSFFDVSRPYSKVLRAVGSGADVDDPWLSFADMFEVGELLSVRVKKVEVLPTKKKIILTTDPSEIHKNYSSENLVEGMVFSAAVESVEDHGYIMDMGIENTRCFLPKENVSKFVKSINRGRGLGVGQIVFCQVTAVKEAGGLFNVTLSADPKSVHKFKYADEMCLNYSLLIPGMMMDALVTEIFKGGIKVQVMDLEGLIHKDHLRETWTDPGTVELGSSVPARVLYLFPNGTNPYLTLQPKLFPHNRISNECSIPLGSNQIVTVVRPDKGGIIVRFSNGQKGIVSVRRCSDDGSLTMEKIKTQFRKGSSHECKVLDFSNMDGIYIASFQKSMLDEKVVRFDQVEPGVVVKCTVQSWKSAGAVVTFGKVRGFIPILHFGNIPIRNPASKFPPGSSFKAKVIKVVASKQHVFLTAKKDLIRNKVPVLQSYDDCVKGVISKGVVKSTNQGGVILEAVGGTTVFAPVKLLGVEKGVDISSLFFAGRIVSFQIIHANAEKRSCIASLVIRESEVPVDDESDKEISKKEKTKKRKLEAEPVDSTTTTENKRAKKKNKAVEKEEETQVDGASSDAEEMDTEVKVEDSDENETQLPIVSNEGLLLSGGSFWDMNDSGDEKDGFSEVHEDSVAKAGEEVKRLTKKERRKLKEQKLREAETALAHGDLSLTSEDDFERLLMASPNSSICWIKFMAFFLNKGEILKAREIGARALKTILYREEQERFNVWVALLNLENTHGTKESIDAVLNEAVRANDEFKILCTAAEIFVQSKKFEDAEEVFKKMLRKFRDQINPYMKYGKFLYNQKRMDDARELLKKALINLNRTQHVQLISKFCQFELEFGERERGVTMFDQLLGSYPKRIDLWLVYANAVAKIGDLEGAKGVLIRAIECRFPPKKSKPLFARLYEVDKMCGTSDPEAIRQLALEYTKSISSDAP